MALEQVRQSPRNFGFLTSRWTLEQLRSRCRPLQALKSLSGVWRRLKRWAIRLKQGRQHVTSPDPQYELKMRRIRRAKREAQRHPDRKAFLYEDEKTVYRQPGTGLAYAAQGSGGKFQPRAERSYAANSKHRLAGTLDAVAGRVVWLGRSVMGVPGLCALLEKVRAAYPRRELAIAWDNWPLHEHPRVEETARNHHIRLLPLPTYAPWTNPEEKLWRKLEVEVLRMHDLADRWPELKDLVHAFLDRFRRSSKSLLRYVGLAGGP